MDQAKRRQIKQQEQGYTAPLGEAVCAACVEDCALKAFIADHAESSDCSFCGRTSETAIAADTDEMLDFIASGLAKEWLNAEEEYFRDSESESGLAGATYDIRDVLEEEAPIFANEKFQEFVIDAFLETTYCPRNYAVMDGGDALNFGWSDLVQTVKHSQRFFFVLNENDRPDDEPGVPIPRGAEMLGALGELIHEYGLVQDLKEKAPLYRARQHSLRKRYTAAKDLGAPPEDAASQSRMSPAGIPMLYTADDSDTAIAETVGSSRSRAKGITIAKFQTTEAMRIVDLSELDPVPSIFDDREETPQIRNELGFLHGFRRDIRKRVTHDGREHIDYVPTQVVCEYLRHQLPAKHGGPVQGVAWKSARGGARNVVLFLDREHCVEFGERPPRVSGPLVELLATDRRRLP